MKKKALPVILIPLAIALGVLSFPSGLNTRLQNSLAEKALFLSRLFAKKPSSEPSEVVNSWLKQREISYSLASRSAQALSPFTVLQEPSHSEYVVAQVLMRSPSRWNSTLWVNKGSDDSPYIKKNSPVLSGDSVVGVVDYVGKHASCVQLITDSRLSCAVRVARGAYDRSLCHALQELLRASQTEALTFTNEDEKKAFLWILQNLRELEELPKQPEFLAKGVLQGTHDSLLLKGTGFNLDFRDQHGPARDLRTGEAINASKPRTPILQVGDLLITSGMDGTFPEGLKVATIQSIMPLTEGAFAYELVATPTASNLDSLEHLTILAPQEFDPDNLPTQVDLILDQLASP